MHLQDYASVNIEDVFERTQLDVRKTRTQTKSMSFIKKQSLKGGRPVGRPKVNRSSDESANKMKKDTEFDNLVSTSNLKIEPRENSEMNLLAKSSENETITDEETCRVKTKDNINLRQPKREPVGNAKDPGEIIFKFT